MMHYTVPVIKQLHKSVDSPSDNSSFILQCMVPVISIQLILVAYVLVCFATRRFLWLSLRFANIAVAFSCISVIPKITVKH